MKPRSLLFLTFAGLTFLPGCENTMATFSSSVTPVATDPDIVTVKLAQAADKAAQALDSIAAIEQARSPVTPPIEDYTNAPASLMQPVSLRWSGDAALVTRALAERAGYRFHVKGNQPPVPVIVNVDAYQRPILHILRDIGLQAGHRADIAIDGAAGVIELRYAPADLPESHHASEIK
ncbi:MAG: DotD/TraH family lipoprotein [Pseudomonadota bacterium]|nr:DotD/TraH family lipoprotein [Pseudomonadota bacterium]